LPDARFGDAFLAVNLALATRRANAGKSSGMPHTGVCVPVSLAVTLHPRAVPLTDTGEKASSPPYFVRTGPDPDLRQLLNRIESHFRPVQEFVFNNTDYPDWNTARSAPSPTT